MTTEGKTPLTPTMPAALKAHPGMTVWEAIALLARQSPFTKEKVETALGVELVAPEDAGNEFFAFYRQSRELALASGALHAIDLRVQRGGGPGFLLVHLRGACIALEAVREHYPVLHITDMPRGRSLDEATTYSSTDRWGKLSFMFGERDPACLARIAFAPAAAAR